MLRPMIERIRRWRDLRDVRRNSAGSTWTARDHAFAVEYRADRRRLGIGRRSGRRFELQRKDGTWF